MYRLRGNEHYAGGLYRQATEAYSRAIDLLELPAAPGGGGDDAAAAISGAASESGVLAVCLSNRAAAWLRRKQWDAALADCNRVLRSGCVPRARKTSTTLRCSGISLTLHCIASRRIALCLHQAHR